jgi:predicted SAM-dependent methyltransferase
VIGLNVGSGQRPFTSTPEITWSNIDKIDRPGQKADIILDCSQGLPYPVDYVDYVVLHHVIEHFGCGECCGLIENCKKVLKPGGSLLVFVPNLRALAVRWLAGQLDTQVYLTNVYGAYMGDEADRHHWGFDADYLEAFLHARAFDNVKPFDWRSIPGSDLAQDWWILAYEAIK